MSTKVKIFLFTPIISLLLSLAVSLLPSSIETQLLLQNMPLETLGLLKGMSFLIHVILQILIFVVLFIFAKKKNYLELFSVTFLILTLLCGVNAIGITTPLPYPLQCFLYALSTLFKGPLFYVFLWVFINHFFTPNEGMRHYLYIGLVNVIGASIGTLLTLPIMKLCGPGSSMVIIPSVILLCASILYYFATVYTSQKEETLQSTGKNFPYLSTAWILAGGVIVTSLASVSYYKFVLRMLCPTTAGYHAYIEKMDSDIMWLSILFFPLLFTIIAILLYRKKWTLSLILSSLFILVGGYSYYLLLAVGHPIPQMVATFIMTTKQCLYPFIIFPLIQILYLYFSQKKRVKLLLITQLLLAPIFTFLFASKFTQVLFLFLLNTYPSLKSASPLICTIGLTTLTLLIIAIIRVCRWQTRQQLNLENSQ